jgi:hypothetical protein
MHMVDTRDIDVIAAELVVENERLRSRLAAIERQFTRYKERMETLETGTLEALSSLGYIVLQEGGDIADNLNEPHYIQWVRWAMTDGWAELTAPTVDVSWAGPQDNTAFATLLNEKLGPLRAELNLE